MNAELQIPGITDIHDLGPLTLSCLLQALGSSGCKVDAHEEWCMFCILQTESLFLTAAQGNLNSRGLRLRSQ